MEKMYKDEVIHIDTGARAYIGKLDISDHPMGADWIRIKDPAEAVMVKNQAGHLALQINPIDYPHKNYRKFVDMRIPADQQIEIRVLDKNGELYKVYNNAMNAQRATRIISPGTADIINIGKN